MADGKEKHEPITRPEIATRSSGPGITLTSQENCKHRYSSAATGSLVDLPPLKNTKPQIEI